MPELENSPRVYIDIEGSSDFVKKLCKKMPELAKVRTIILEEQNKIEIKESEGISSAFIKYANVYFNSKGVSQDDRAKVIASIYDKCPFLRGQ